jgi:hypothetical protein
VSEGRSQTVGEFTFDFEAMTVSGPASYMQERGDAHLAEIKAGRDPVVNSGYSPDPITGILVSLQTDYAGWRGQKQMEGWLAGGSAA